MIAVVVAMARGRVIGASNDLPWHLPADLRHFKRLTVGHTVVMGRKTYESIAARIGGPLPGRKNVVLTSDQRLRSPGVVLARSFAEALAVANPNETTFVIGGAQVYAQAMPLADELYVTEIDIDVTGDTYFPPLDLSVWTETARENHRADDRNPHDYAFVTYRRVRLQSAP